MDIKIDINKMSTESREDYLIDLIADMADALESYPTAKALDASLISYARLAVIQSKTKGA